MVISADPAVAPDPHAAPLDRWETTRTVAPLSC
jgi:hypothetical protein